MLGLSFLMLTEKEELGFEGGLRAVFWFELSVNWSIFSKKLVFLRSSSRGPGPWRVCGLKGLKLKGEN